MDGKDNTGKQSVNTNNYKLNICGKVNYGN